MKLPNVFVAALLSFSAVMANASSGSISCSNGKIEDVGDRHLQIDILKDGIHFLPYEGSFFVENAKIQRSNGKYSIINKIVQVTAEGEVSKRLLNSVLKLNEKSMTLNVSIRFDRQSRHSQILKCIRQ